MTKICLIAAFPPSAGPLSEYSYHIAREFQRHKDVELTILADELEESATSADSPENPIHPLWSQQLPGVKIIRCWKFGSVATPLRILNMIRQIKPDVVWFNLVFSSFGGPSNPFAAFAGLSAPALTRAAGFYTHITLHHIVEHVDFSSAGVPRERLYRKGTDLATRSLLRAHSVSVLLSDYRRTLMAKYSAENIIVGTHGTFASIPNPPDFTKRGNPDLRILAFGNWGTYKRLEKLIEAFPSVLEKVPNARLIIAGGNHPAAAGYWESVRDSQPAGLPIEFLGYVQEKDVPKLFATSSLLVMPYDSSTGSSGPAHQACEFGVPIVCADISDFRCMATDDDMAILFYKKGDSSDLADKLVTILQSPELQRKMSEYNYEAGVQMTMANVSRNYLRWFELHKYKRSIAPEGRLARLRGHYLNLLSTYSSKSVDHWAQGANVLPKVTSGDSLRNRETDVADTAQPSYWDRARQE
jgi:glycosyltransferase involved in cell wall biosynthesis